MSHSKSQDKHVLLLKPCFSEARDWYRIKNACCGSKVKSLLWVTRWEEGVSDHSLVDGQNKRVQRDIGTKGKSGLAGGTMPIGKLAESARTRKASKLPMNFKKLQW